MIITGILGRSLNQQLCIRGFAPIKEIARVSKADYSYQRQTKDDQEEKIKRSLEYDDFLFFPEVILSYQVKYDISKPNARMDYTPLQILELENKFTSNVDKTNFKVKNGSIKIVEMSLDDEILEEAIRKGNHPFHRVDGNHRLKAAENATSDKVKMMVTPFCIILSEFIISEITNPDGTVQKIEESKGEKFEKIVFHDINAKARPLTSEENLKVILDDSYNFTDDDLLFRFGPEFVLTRHIYKGLPENLNDVYPNLGEKFCKNPRTFSNEILEILFEKTQHIEFKISPQKIKDALKVVNQLFGNYKELKNLNCIGIVECAIYLQILNRNLKLFINWLIENKLATLDEISANSLIDIYEKIRESKSKQIFVSMQFDEASKPRYNAIKKAVDEINKNYSLEIKLREIRIDKFNEGHSYKIDDKILELIEESGLLIADLTTGNKNVYHELGFLMGLNQGKNKTQSNFILLEQMTPEMKDSDIGFNIRAFQQLRFGDTLDLKDKLVKALEEYYNLS